MISKGKLKKIYISVVAAFIAFSFAFYYLSGEQLWYKASEKNIKMHEADSITKEIVAGITVKQNFICTVDRLESMSFMFTKNYQTGDGILRIRLLEGENVLIDDYTPLNDVPEQHSLDISPREIIENLKGKRLTIEITSTSNSGSAASVLLDSQANSNIDVGGQVVPGTICFSVTGSDMIPVSSYYWYLMTGACVVLSLILFISYKRYLKGKNGYIVSALNAIEKYSFLISQLVSRDIKTKYKRSVFGIFWSFLNPLLTMTVQFLVFSTFFKADTRNYPVYLIVGVVCFSFFNECTTMCLSSISSNYRLITKVYIPKYIFPLSKAISASINLAISLVPLLLVAIITGTVLHLQFFLMFYFLLCLIIFSLGVGMFLATLMVFFRDVQFLWSVLCTIWQYATPIFYPAEIIPEKYRFIVRLNPLYHFIGNARKCLIDGISPEPMAYVYCLIFALGSLAIGSFIFKKCQDKFTLYL